MRFSDVGVVVFPKGRCCPFSPMHLWASLHNYSYVVHCLGNAVSRRHRSPLFKKAAQLCQADAAALETRDCSISRNLTPLVSSQPAKRPAPHSNSACALRICVNAIFAAWKLILVSAICRDFYPRHGLVESPSLLSFIQGYKGSSQGNAPVILSCARWATVDRGQRGRPASAPPLARWERMCVLCKTGAAPATCLLAAFYRAERPMKAAGR